MFHFASVLRGLIHDAIRFTSLALRSNVALRAENLFLRKQLALYLEREVKPRRPTDGIRLGMVLLSAAFRVGKRVGHRQARNFSSVASEGLQPVLAVEVEAARPTVRSRRPSGVNWHNGT